MSQGNILILAVLAVFFVVSQFGTTEANPLFLGQGGVKKSEAAVDYFSQRFGSGFLADLAALQKGSKAKATQKRPVPIPEESAQVPEFKTKVTTASDKKRLYKVVKKARTTTVAPKIAQSPPVFVDYSIDAEAPTTSMHGDDILPYKTEDLLILKDSDYLYPEGLEGNSLDY